MTLWAWIILASALSYLVKLAGYLLPETWVDDPRIVTIANYLTVGLLAGLVVTNTVATPMVCPLTLGSSHSSQPSPRSCCAHPSSLLSSSGWPQQPSPGSPDSHSPHQAPHIRCPHPRQPSPKWGIRGRFPVVVRKIASGGSRSQTSVITVRY